jgi:phosphate-selective porin OprO/OprP
MRFLIAIPNRLVAVLGIAAALGAINVLATDVYGQFARGNPPISDNYGWDAGVIGSNQIAFANNAPTLTEPQNQIGSSAKDATQLISPYPPPKNESALTPPIGESASQSSETDLAKRVAALEEYIRRMQAAGSETLPPPKPDATKPEAPAIADCIPKKIDAITRPTFIPLGRIVFDTVTYDDDPADMAFFNTDRANELGFRSIRLGGKGYIYENLYYNAEVEFRGANSSINYKDIYIEQQSLPYVGHIRTGHFKEPIGLEDVGSDLFLEYMERSPGTQAFVPSRNFGMMFWDTTDECQDISWFTGIFRADSPESPSNTGEWRSNNNDWCYDARAAWLPYYDEPSNGRYLVHVGGSYSFRHIGGLTPGATYNQNIPYSTLNGLAEFSTRSWVGSQGPLGFGTEANSDQWNQIDPEFLAIWGPVTFQAEYFQLFMNSGEQYNGGYAFLSYFLTGENHGYRKDLKVMDRTIPNEPFFLVNTANGHSCGWGAWEVTAGYSWANLDDGHDIVATNPATAANRRRGFDNAVVVGLNWYQNAWAVMKFDYSHEIVDYVDAGVPTQNANIFGVRLQVDW